MTPHPALHNLDTLARLMDSQFRIPGTRIRFGLDAVLGLVPGFGDAATMLVSFFMLMKMASHGASGFLLARMALNVALDSLIGSIPFIGDLFDIAFKANQRNLRLMHEHYAEGKHQGSAMKVIIPILLILLLTIGLALWGMYAVIRWVVEWASGL